VWSNPYHRFEVNGNVQTKNGGTVNLIWGKKLRVANMLLTVVLAVIVAFIYTYLLKLQIVMLVSVVVYTL